MDIAFETAALAKTCNDAKLLRRAYGQENAKRIRRRLDDLRAALTLDAMRHLPGRCHELKGDRKGQLALDARHPLRLIFRPAYPPPLNPDGGLEWQKVTAIIVSEIVDYHD